MRPPLRSALFLAVAAASNASPGDAPIQPDGSGQVFVPGMRAARSVPVADTAAEIKQLMARLAALSADSMEGRLAGSPGGWRARKWIERELQSIGVAALGKSYEQPVRLRKTTASDTLGANIIARVPGLGSAGGVIVLSAHYDHLGVRGGNIYNGADDNASGCVALITIAERLKKRGVAHDVLLVFFDAEESDLVGARAFVAAPPLALRNVAIDINLDMVSRGDAGALWVSGVSHYPFLKSVTDIPRSEASIPIRLGHDTKDLKPGDDWTESSDHGAFHDRGIPFLYLGVEDHVDYHRPGDDASKVKPAFFAGAVNFAEALLRSVDGAVARFPSR